MKVSVRQGVFETNSSSVHTLTMCSDSGYNKWKNGELLYGKYSEVFITREEYEANKEKYDSYDNGETDSYITCKNSDGEKDDGYIDHTEDLGDFIESTVFNETKLLNYLFDYNSYVSTGNDNVDEEVETPDFGSSWDFDKGN